MSSGHLHNTPKLAFEEKGGRNGHFLFQDSYEKAFDNRPCVRSLKNTYFFMALGDHLSVATTDQFSYQFKQPIDTDAQSQIPQTSEESSLSVLIPQDISEKFGSPLKRHYFLCHEYEKQGYHAADSNAMDPIKRNILICGLSCYGGAAGMVLLCFLIHHWVFIVGILPVAVGTAAVAGYYSMQEKEICHLANVSGESRLQQVDAYEEKQVHTANIKLFFFPFYYAIRGHHSLLCTDRRLRAETREQGEINQEYFNKQNKLFADHHNNLNAQLHDYKFYYGSGGGTKKTVAISPLKFYMNRGINFDALTKNHQQTFLQEMKDCPLYTQAYQYKKNNKQDSVSVPSKFNTLDADAKKPDSQLMRTHPPKNPEILKAYKIVQSQKLEHIKNQELKNKQHFKELCNYYDLDWNYMQDSTVTFDTVAKQLNLK